MLDATNAPTGDHDPLRICAGPDLQDSGVGVCFQIMRATTVLAAFAIRYEGRVHAFLNRCRHMDLELDWEPGNFFDVNGRYIVCATHGALYELASGFCIAGPCKGEQLVILPVFECGGSVYLAPASACSLVKT
ncbi:MAG: Rieske 2Fe-2S domain-containing protein [Gammaproteobacteria bacterium]|nr:Rieske 2Fe-2S domain-containing protein [Gammaproteobacteria bacterium]